MTLASLSAVHAQEDDLDNVGESIENFDDLEQEIENADRQDAQKQDLDIEDSNLQEELDAEMPSQQAEEQVTPAPVENEPAEEVAEEAEPVPAPEIAAPMPSEMPIADDQPDAEFEERMGRIYKQFYSGKISDAEWFQIVGPKSSEKYTVQSGDTMWGMSTTFFGNGFFWPKLWQLNSDYTNPHILEPGEVLSFSPGSVSQEPSVNVGKNRYAFNETEAKASVTPEQAKAYLANAEIPAPPAFRPVLKNIPRSIPSWTQADRKYDNAGFSISRKKRLQDIGDETLLHSYISDRAPSSIGRVIEMEAGGDRAALFQEVILELEAAAEGEIYTAFKTLDKMSNSYMSVPGYPVEFQGELEIIESLGDNRFRAIVKNMVAPIERGAQLFRGNIPVTSYSKEGASGSASVTVVGGEFDADRRLMATNTIIYLNGGSRDGVQEGEIYSILKSPVERNAETVVKTVQGPIALVRIVNTSERLSTALVLEARGDIRPGDKTGSRERFQ